MRKASYAVSFVSTLTILLANVFMIISPDILVYKTPEILKSRVIVYYGLNQICERKTVNVPGSEPWTSYECRKFPTRKEDCEDGYATFCSLWSSASYSSFLAIGFASIALLAVLFGVSTHSRRRRIWKAVAGLLAFQAGFQLITFGIVTHLYRTDAYPTFENAKPGIAYVLNTIGWVLGVLTVGGVVTTGVEADRGKKWAAGNRAYRRIHD